MRIITADEVATLLDEHRRANIRDYITSGEGGEEEIDLLKAAGEGRMRPIKRIRQLNDKIVEIGLTNGQVARNDEVVYLIRAANGLVKIGFTNNLARRLHNLNSASPLDLKVIGCIKTAIAETIEAELHERYRHLRIRGEWFQLDDADVRDILNGELWREDRQS